MEESKKSAAASADPLKTFAEQLSARLQLGPSMAAAATANRQKFRDNQHVAIEDDDVRR